MINREAWLIQIINASITAGKEILTVYNSDFSVENKEDNSPLTKADKRAHLAILAELKKTGLPILSEEGRQADYSTRQNWKQFWLVDPLDGTKEFVKRNGEFTVNIALIENGTPTMGVIYVPVTKVLYFADKIAYKIEQVDDPIPSINNLLGKAEQLPLKQTRTSFVILGSRSHMSAKTEMFIAEQKTLHKNVQLLFKGSSLKLCMVAEGCADIYPRFGPTMEWDIAAGHAIVKASGGEVVHPETNREVKYNKENLLNSSFLVRR